MKNILPKKYKIKLNSLPKIEELLQQLYDEVCKNLEEIKKQMSKLDSSVALNEEPVDAKAKFAKAMNDFITNMDKAIGRKLEIAKFMGEIMKYNGDVSKALNESSNTMDIGDWEAIKQAAIDDGSKPEPENYTIGD